VSKASRPKLDEKNAIWRDFGRAVNSEGPVTPISTRLVVTLAVLASWSASIAATTLSPEDAKGQIGETATVCGVVVSTEYEANEQSQSTLLDLGKPASSVQQFYTDDDVILTFKLRAPWSLD
jgi:hypothetical protein